MKNYYQKITLVFAALFCMAMTLRAQTFDFTTSYDTIPNNGDTLTFNIPGTPTGAWGVGFLRVYYQGAFGSDYMSAFDEGWNYLGDVGPHPSQNDCMPEDSVDFYFPAATINGWAANGSIDFPLINYTNPFCFRNLVKVRLVYNYCSFGTPTAYASLTAAQEWLCPTDAPTTLTGTPSGGTYAGPGVAGNSFDPQGLAAGVYWLTYSATDNIGCVTTDTLAIRVLQTPLVNDTWACPGTTADLQVFSGANHYWYDALPIGTPVDSGNTFTTPVLHGPATYYVVAVDRNESAAIDTILGSNYATVDHDNLTGDDRGGIAITPDYVYINGDNSIARYDAGTFSNPTVFPMHDGLFSDLRNGELWTLWSTVSNSAPLNPSGFVLNSLQTMDTDLNLTGSVLYLDTTLVIDNNNDWMMLAGYGYLGLYDGDDYHFYVVDLDNGHVEDLGMNSNFGGEFYTSENWAAWGVIEYDCDSFYAVYRDEFSDNIVRMTIPSGNVVQVSNFPSDVSDLASFTYSRWENRWYFHYETSSGMFGGNYETLGYADADATGGTVCSVGGIGCYSAVEVDVTVANIGTDASVCDGNNATFVAGLGYSSYTWNGNNTNLNSYSTSAAGNVLFEGIDFYGCTIRDTATVTVSPNPVADFGFSVQGNGFDVQFNDQSSGSGNLTYAWNFDDGGSSTVPSPTHTYTANGAYDVCLTVSQTNGCENTFCDRILLPATGVADEIDGFVSLFPNPATNQTRLQVEFASPRDLEVNLQNVMGQNFYHQQLKGFHQGNVDLDLSNLAAGVYFVQLKTIKGQATLRLIVE